MSRVLELSPEDFRIIGRALEEFGRGDAADSADDDDREQALGLHEVLQRWGYLTESARHPAAG